LWAVASVEAWARATAAKLAPGTGTAWAVVQVERWADVSAKKLAREMAAVTVDSLARD
jgi:hypothetical protein